MTHNVHATGLVLDGTGLLIRGPSGAGKSLLALDLLDQWEARELPAALVADDRVDLLVGDGGLTMSVPERIGGLVELRGRGIVRRPFVSQAALHLVVDLVDELERMLDPAALTTELLGVEVPRVPVPRAGVAEGRHQVLLVREALRSLDSRHAAGQRQKFT